MTEHHTLTSEKYYVDKLKTEAQLIRRYQAGQTIKAFITFTALCGFFTVCGYALYTNPGFVPDSIDYMRANGILSY
jgi:hypothetical protein